jgi:hypothetical protein
VLCFCSVTAPNVTAGSMLAAIPVRETQNNKQAPLTPVMDVPADVPAKLSFMQSVWVSISVSASATLLYP